MRARADKLALVIPALREAENLEPLLSGLRSVLDQADITWEVIVVDDDSPDRTEEIVAAISREDPRVRLLVRRGERGLAGAVLHGWRHSDATILGAMDADGQHPPEFLPVLMEAVANGHDLAIASRYAHGGHNGWNPIRRLLSMGAILAARPVQSTWLQVRDPLSGFFVVRRTCIENVSFQTSGYKLLLEILVRGQVRDLVEVPFKFEKRKAGRSKLSLRVAWEYMVLLAGLFGAKYGLHRSARQTQGD